jgi:hypothetical protein
VARREPPPLSCSAISDNILYPIYELGDKASRIDLVRPPYRAAAVSAAKERIMDRYTKAVLTVIAAALTTIVLQNAGVVSARAQEQNAILKVQICQPDKDGTPECANVGQHVDGWRGLYILSSLTKLPEAK